MGKTPEAKVRDPVVKYAKEIGYLHFRMSFRIGVRQACPDDLFISPQGVPVFIEFKAPGKEPTKLQQHRLKELRLQKVCAVACDNVEWGKAVLDTVLKRRLSR